MKTLLTTLNAKYIHKSLSLRLLYVACKDAFVIDFKEYTIKDSILHIVEDIIEQQVDIIGFSVYIWNVEAIQEICKQIKQKQPTIQIILGGPEVSYDVDYFLDTFMIDYVISGEGEEALPQLLEQIEKQKPLTVQGVSSQKQRDPRQTKPVSLSYIESLDSPYLLPRDMADMKHRILYFETSRGCPYQCQYCLSSLEKGLRFFSKEYLRQQLSLLLKTEVKTIKFLDRSFNADPEHALYMLSYISENYRPGMQFQFEINADVLDQRILDFIIHKAPKHIFRFEIGIQSTYQETNKVVKRYQDFSRLANVIQQLQAADTIDLHLDLIAGLPLENKERFAQSFDDVFAFRPKELQLGFLKLLRGTGLRKRYTEYGYQFDDIAPYEIRESKDISQQDIQDIHIVEDMLEKYWNSGKMPLAMSYLLEHQPSPFYFFLSLGTFYQEQKYKVIQYQNHELFQYLAQYMEHQGLDGLPILIEDYLRLAKSKPKRWWTPTLVKGEIKVVLHELIEKYQLDAELVFRYGMVERFPTYDVIAIYKEYQSTVTRYQRT